MVEQQVNAPDLFVKYGLGFGISGGVDLDTGNLVAIPIEVSYLGSTGDDIDDVSGFGVLVGITFNF